MLKKNYYLKITITIYRAITRALIGGEGCIFIFSINFQVTIGFPAF